ncbi:MAG: hypothetical protein ACYCTF_02205 [Acidiferrobacter sp.]
MQLDAVSTHRVLVNLWKPFLVLVGGLFVLRSLKRDLNRALALLPRNSLFSVMALHAIGRFIIALLYTPLLLVTRRIAGFQLSGALDTFAGFLTVLGAGMVVVWSILRHITATFIVLIWRPCRLGLPIEVAPDGIQGKDCDSNRMYAEVEESQGSTVLIPDKLFFQKYVHRLLLPAKATVMLSTPLRAGVVAGEDEGRVFERGWPAQG